MCARQIFDRPSVRIHVHIYRCYLSSGGLADLRLTRAESCFISLEQISLSGTGVSDQHSVLPHSQRCRKDLCSSEAKP